MPGRQSVDSFRQRREPGQPPAGTQPAGSATGGEHAKGRRGTAVAAAVGREQLDAADEFLVRDLREIGCGLLERGVVHGVAGQALPVTHLATAEIAIAIVNQ